MDPVWQTQSLCFQNTFGLISCESVTQIRLVGQRSERSHHWNTDNEIDQEEKQDFMTVHWNGTCFQEKPVILW